MEGRLVLVSPFDPDARWFAFTAMERNKLIYALSSGALVVAAAAESGGTWAGAVEALEQRRVTVYIKCVGNVSAGNHKLMARGGKPFPSEPWNDLRSLFVHVTQEPTLFSAVNEGPAEPRAEPAPAIAEEQPPVPRQSTSPETPPKRGRDAYSFVLPALLAAVADPGTEEKVEQALGLVPAQAKAWLKRACDEGLVRKSGRPARYASVQSPLPLLSRPEEETRGPLPDTRP